MIGGGLADVPLHMKIWRILAHRLENADFQSIFARSATAVTLRKSSINTNRKSTAHFSMSLDIVRIALSPQRVAQNRSVQNLNNER